jgi:hypothetical protein
MSKLSMAAAGVILALVACESRPADRTDQVESGATPGATDTARGDTAAPPGYSGMERDTSAAEGAGEPAGQPGKMDSFRLQQETGRDTGGRSGGEQVKPSGDTARQ